MTIRVKYLIARFIPRAPFAYITVRKYKKHPEKYSLEERVEWVRKLIKKETKQANVQLDIVGKEILPQTGGYLLTPNHQGLFDIFALFNGIDRPFKIVYKQELHKYILVGDVLDFMEYPGIDRQNLRQSIKVIKLATKEIAQGMPYVIFPEGTRSKKGNEMLEFKGGTFKCAIDSKAPIIPCAMIDCYKVLDADNMKKVHCQIHFLKPIPYEEYKDMGGTEVAAYVQKRIETCIKEHA